MTASASAGPDAYSLVSAVNMLYLHACPSPTPAFCVCVPSVSLSFAFLSLSLFCAFLPKYEVPIIGSIVCALFACHCVLLRFSKGLERDRRYRINGAKTPQMALTLYLAPI